MVQKYKFSLSLLALLFFFPICIYTQELFEFQNNSNPKNYITDYQSRSIAYRKLTINDYLISAIDSGNYQLVSYLLVIKKANPNYNNELGITPLMSASMHDNIDITKLLLKMGVNVYFRNTRGENALQWAIMSRKVEQLKLLVDNHSEFNFADSSGISPLFYALGYSQYDLTNYVNEDYDDNITPDTSYSTTYKLLKILVQSGVDINKVNELDCTPILFATFQKDTSLIKILCKLGANPNKTTHAGVPPLIYASQEGSYGVVKTLIENGADVNFKLPDGSNAILNAVRANNDSIAELLLQKKALINDQDYSALTPLHYAVGFGYPYMTQLLISFGANINQKDNYGNTPLITAVYSGAKIVTDILLESGVDVNLSDNKGNTPLMIATQFNDTILISKLFRAGADLNSKNEKNYNALSIAIENNSAEAFKKLIELGANLDSPPFNSYYQHSKEVGCKDIASFLTSKGLKTRLKINISNVNLYSGFSTSQKDFMLDFGIGVHEQVTNLLFNIGYKYRPYSNRALVYKNSSFYQFWEKRYSFYFSLQHLLTLKRNYLKGNVGFIPELSNELSWNYYRGLENNSGVKWFFVPSIGLFYQKSFYTFIGKWEFANYNKLIMEANRFNFQILVSIPTSKRFVNKRIKWLD